MKIFNIFKKKKSVVVEKQLVLNNSPLGGWLTFQNYVGNGDFSQAQYRELFQQFQGLAHRCINVIADNIATAKPFIYTLDNQSESSEPNTHAFLGILNGKGKPNPEQSYYELLYKTIQLLEIVGNCYWKVVRSNYGIPSELYILPVNNNNQMIAKRNEYGKIINWEYKTNSNTTISYKAEDIIHFKFECPFDSTYGMGVVQAGAWTFDKLQKVNEYQLNYYNNGALKKFIIEMDNDISDMEYKKFREDFQTTWKSNSNGIVLKKGMKYQPISNSPLESDYNNTYKQLQDDICSLFGVPPSLVARLDSVNRANAVTANPDFFNFILTPILKKIDAKLTKFVQDNYKNSNNVYVEHKLTIPSDREFDLKRLELECRFGSIYLNELRKELGRDPIPEGNVLVTAKGSESPTLDPMEIPKPESQRPGN